MHVHQVQCFLAIIKLLTSAAMLVTSAFVSLPAFCCSHEKLALDHSPFLSALRAEERGRKERAEMGDYCMFIEFSVSLPLLSSTPLHFQKISASFQPFTTHTHDLSRDSSAADVRLLPSTLHTDDPSPDLCIYIFMRRGKY